MQPALRLLVLGILALNALAAPSFGLTVRDGDGSDISHLFPIYQREKSTANLSKRVTYSIYCGSNANDGLVYTFVQSKCDRSVFVLGWICTSFNALGNPPFIVEGGSCSVGQVCRDTPVALNFRSGMTLDSKVASCVDITNSYRIPVPPRNPNVFFQFRQGLARPPRHPNRPPASSSFDVFFVDPETNATIDATWIDISAEDADHNYLGNARCTDCSFGEMNPIPEDASTLTIDVALPPGLTSGGAVYVAYSPG